MKDKKIIMKKRLWEWGRAMERFHWKEEELKRLQDLYKVQESVWKSNLPLWKAEKRMRACRENLKSRKTELEEILREKERIDGWIERLPMEEGQFLRLRYEKGYGFDYIGIKMHRSRATLFRLQDQALCRMVLESEKDETL